MPGYKPTSPADDCGPQQRPTVISVSGTSVKDRRATREELLAHRDALLSLAAARGLSNLRVRDDAALVVTPSGPGYRQIAGFVDVASELVGASVYVVPDDAPGLAASPTPLRPPQGPPAR